MIAHGPDCESWSSLTHGASSPAVPDGTEMPPIDHWSIGRPHAVPVGLQTIVSLVATGTGTGAEPVTVPRTPVTVPGRPLIGAEPATVPSPPAADGAEPVSVPPVPKYSRVGVAPVNGYVEVSSNRPLPRS